MESTAGPAQPRHRDVYTFFYLPLEVLINSEAPQSLQPIRRCRNIAVAKTVARIGSAYISQRWVYYESLIIKIYGTVRLPYMSTRYCHDQNIDGWLITKLFFFALLQL